MSISGLLAPGEPAPASIDRADGASPFLILCDHAGRRIPAALGTLGLEEADLSRHIALGYWGPPRSPTVLGRRSRQP